PLKFEALDSTARILELFDRNAAAARAVLAKAPARGLKKPGGSRVAAGTITTNPNRPVTRATVLIAPVLRRGQLPVYWRVPGDDGAHEPLTGYLRSVRDRVADYQALLVVNPEGEDLASTAPQPPAVHLPPGWTTTIRADNAVVGDASCDAEHMKSVVVFAVPIYQTGGRLLGALTAKLDLGALHRLLRRFAGGGAQEGQVYLIVADGHALVGSRSAPAELMRRTLDTAAVRGLLE